MILLYDEGDSFSLVSDKGDIFTFKVTEIEDKMHDMRGLTNDCDMHNQFITLELDGEDDNSLYGSIIGIKEPSDNFSYAINLNLQYVSYEFAFQTGSTSIYDSLGYGYFKFDRVEINNIIYNDVFSIQSGYYHDSLAKCIYFNEEFGILQIKDSINYTRIF